MAPDQPRAGLVLGDIRQAVAGGDVAKLREARDKAGLKPGPGVAVGGLAGELRAVGQKQRAPRDELDAGDPGGAAVELAVDVIAEAAAGEGALAGEVLIGVEEADELGVAGALVVAEAELVGPGRLGLDLDRIAGEAGEKPRVLPAKTSSQGPRGAKAPIPGRRIPARRGSSTSAPTSIRWLRMSSARRPGKTCTAPMRKSSCTWAARAWAQASESRVVVVGASARTSAPSVIIHRSWV